MNKEIEILSNYGTVVTCKEIKEQVVTIVLTHGFTSNATKTFEFIGKCYELFPDYPVMTTCITEDNLAIIVLTK